MSTTVHSINNTTCQPTSSTSPCWDPARLSSSFRFPHRLPHPPLLYCPLGCPHCFLYVIFLPHSRFVQNYLGQEWFLTRVLKGSWSSGYYPGVGKHRKDDRGREKEQHGFAMRGMQALAATVHTGVRLCSILPSRRAAQVRHRAQGIWS